MAKAPLTCGKICRRIFNWILQILVLAVIIAIPILISMDPNNNLWMLILIFLTYIAYIINELCSPTFAYLRNKHKANTIHDYMNNLYTTPPTKTFHVECYHYETRIHTERDNNGETRTRTERVKIVTHRGSQDFYYYSWRDISGIFLLETSKFLDKDFKKAYIKLKVNLDVLYAEDGTHTDYIIQRDVFYCANRWRDQHMHTWETTTLPGLEKYNMVRVSDNKTPYVNKGMFLLFTLLFPFAEFYKIYVNQYCEDQTYTLKKVISSRNNLNQPTHFERYESMVPKLCIYGEVIVYTKETVLIRSSPYMPSEDDLNAHEKEKTHMPNPQVNININQGMSGNPHMQQGNTQLHIQTTGTSQNNQSHSSLPSFDAVTESPHNNQSGYNTNDQMGHNQGYNANNQVGYNNNNWQQPNQTDQPNQQNNQQYNNNFNPMYQGSTNDANTKFI
jgi:hypothetical protein